MCLIVLHAITTLKSAVRLHIQVSFSSAAPPFMYLFQLRNRMFLRVCLFLMDTKLNNICLVLLLQIFNHPEACGTCGLHNAYGWWILVKLISGTVLTPRDFRGAHSHYYTEKSLPDCKADAWILHREQKCPTQCSTRAANELFISYHWDCILPQNLK